MYNATFNDVYGQDQEYQELINITRIAIPIVFAIITLSGLLGNGLVIWTVLKNIKMRTPINLLILNLAVADILFIVICVPFTAVEYALPKYILGRVCCKISYYFMYVSACVSIYSLVFMSVVRCIIVVCPLSSRSWVTTRRVYIVIAVIWIVMLCGFTPLLYQYDVFTYTYLGEVRSTCLNLDVVSSKNLRKTFYALFLTFGYAMPLFIMVILYGTILAMLKCGTKHTKTIECSAMRNRVQSRATKMVIAVIFCFLLCWLPIHVVPMLGSLGSATANKLVQILVDSLSFLNSCLNPILYAFLSSRFRQSFKQALCCGGRSETR